MEKINKEDIEMIMPTKEHYLKAVKRMYNTGWTITAEKMRNAYNKISSEDKISKKEVKEKPQTWISKYNTKYWKRSSRE